MHMSATVTEIIKRGATLIQTVHLLPSSWTLDGLQGQYLNFYSFKTNGIKNLDLNYSFMQQFYDARLTAILYK